MRKQARIRCFFTLDTAFYTANGSILTLFEICQVHPTLVLSIAINFQTFQKSRVVTVCSIFHSKRYARFDDSYK